MQGQVLLRDCPFIVQENAMRHYKALLGGRSSSLGADVSANIILRFYGRFLVIRRASSLYPTQIRMGAHVFTRKRLNCRAKPYYSPFSRNTLLRYDQRATPKLNT